jgi:hypothetical protein
MQTVISDRAFWEITAGVLIFLTLLCYIVWKHKTGRTLTGFQSKLLKSMRKMPPQGQRSANQKSPGAAAGDSQPAKKKATHS